MLYPMLVYAKQQVGLEKAVEESMPVFYSAVPITFAFIIALFIVILHKTNIERLMTGKESKIGSKSKKQQKFSVSKDDKK